jgi:hypothetical protein
MGNYNDSILYDNKHESDVQFSANEKFSRKRNNINLKDMSSEVDVNFNKYNFDKEITNEGSQLMKSPSMESIQMDYKEKTAEFEKEDLSENHQSEKKGNSPNILTKEKKICFSSLRKEEQQKLFSRQDDYRQMQILQSSLVSSFNSHLGLP